MKSSPSAPPAPDPNATAAAQTQSNLATAIANSELNRVSQQTPWGSINYSVTGKNPDGTPIYSSNIALSPAQQQLLNQQQGNSATRNTMASQILGQQGGRITAPLNFSALAPIVNHGQTYQGAVNAPSTQAAVQAAQPPQSAAPPNSDGSTGTTAGMGMSPAQFQAILQAITQSQGQQASPSGSSPASPQPSASSSGNASSPYGSAGNIDQVLASLGPNGQLPSSMPSYLQSQVFQTQGSGTSGGDGGASTGPQLSYSHNLNDQKGNPVVQLGRDPSQIPTAANSQGMGLMAGNNAHYDPDLGWVVDPKYIATGKPSWLNPATGVGLILGAGALGGAMGLGGAAASGGTGAFDVGGSTGFGGTTPLEAGANPITAGAPTGAFDTAGSTGFGGTTPLGTTPFSQLQAVGQHAVDNIASGRGLLGMRTPISSGLSTLVQFLRNRQSTGGP